MFIRDAVVDDLGAISELLLVVHRMHVKAHPGTYREISLEEAREFAAPRPTDAGARLRVAECDSEVLGYY